MSWIKDNVFSGAAKDAAREQQEAFRDAQDITRQAAQEARSDIMNLFPQAQDMQMQGFQSALNTFNQAGPAQASMANMGNQNAQATLLAGLPQMNNALLGGPVDYSQLQQRTVAFNPNNFMANMPDFLGQQNNQVDTGAVMGPVNGNSVGMPPTVVNTDNYQNPIFSNQGAAFGQSPMNQQFFLGGGNQPAFSSDFAGGTGGLGGRPVTDASFLNLR